MHAGNHMGIMTTFKKPTAERTAARERPFPPLAPTHPVAPAPPTEVSPSSPALSGGRLAQPALAARRRRLALRGLGDGQAAPLGLRGGD
jgi:hypothetical protein